MVSESRVTALAYVVLVMAVLAAVMPVAAPMKAMAAIDSVLWAVPAYQGYDSFHDSNVRAFTAGTTATVTAHVTNDQPVDVTIRESRITLDWGADIEGVGPAELQAGETGSFSFTVPVPSGASNLVLHSYQVKVGYQRQGAPYVRSYHADESIGNGDGATLQFYTAAAPILASSLEVYWRDTIPTPDTITQRDPSSYIVDARTGRIIFGVAPPVGTEVIVDYQCFQSLGSGNGAITVFYTDSRPVVNGSLQVYIGSAAAESFVVATGWTADFETGKVTLASAPTAFETVHATYESWDRWPVVSGTNLAVYSADQAGAMASAQQYNVLHTSYPDHLFAPGTAAQVAQLEASALAAMAAAEYAAGGFVAAHTNYDAAVVAMQSAIDALAQALWPVVATDNASGLSASSARLNGNVTSRGSADNVTVSFVWGSTQGTHNHETAGDVMSGAGAFYFDLDGLAPGATYYYKARAVGAGTSYGAEYSFTTLGTAPVVATDNADSITSTSARVNGNLTSLGTGGSVTVSLVWGNTPGGPYPSETAGVARTGAGAFYFELVGLSPGLTYCCRAKAAGGGFTVYGDELTFATPILGDTAAPVISSVTHSDITEAGAAITWTTDEAATSQVEYGLSEQYGSTSTLDNSLVTGHRCSLTGLAAGQCYHYRVVSVDSSGNRAASTDATFTAIAAATGTGQPGGGMPAWAWTIILLAAAGGAGIIAFLLGWRIARR